MKMVLLGLSALAFPACVQAQNMAPPTALGPLASTGFSNEATDRATEADPLRGSLETPTMKRQKLERAIALRDEVARLQAKDGGTLSARHVRYMQRKADAILAYTRILPGTMIEYR